MGHSPSSLALPKRFVIVSWLKFTCSYRADLPSISLQSRFTCAAHQTMRYSACLTFPHLLVSTIFLRSCRPRSQEFTLQAVQKDSQATRET